MCERSGVVNIGIEGMMLAAAFVGWIVGRRPRAGPRPADPSPFFGRHAGRSLIALVAGGPVGGRDLACSTPGCRSRVRADQIISGTIINIAAVGLTGYLNTLISRRARPTSAGYVRAVRAARAALTDLPVIGWIARRCSSTRARSRSP